VDDGDVGHVRPTWFSSLEELPDYVRKVCGECLLDTRPESFLQIVENRKPPLGVGNTKMEKPSLGVGMYGNLSPRTTFAT